MELERAFAPVMMSPNMERAEAGIALTPEMYKLLSSGIYEDKELAPIRELTCNAWDIQDEVDSSVSIIMHLPNSFEPWFTIRDYGTGLTHEQVMSMYLTYGHSTKSKDNDSIGGFGIGSKSPLAYTDSFLVNSYQGGVERQYNIFMLEGIPQIAKLMEGPTEEGDGLMVSVPVQQEDFYTFEKKAAKFLKVFHLSAKVTITGVTSIADSLDIMVEGEGYKVVDDYGSGVFVTMGGVAYRVSDSLIPDLSIINLGSYRALLLDFNIGDIKVTASRETIEMTDDAKNLIALRIDGILKLFKDEVNAKIDEEANLWDAIGSMFNKHGASIDHWQKEMSQPWMAYAGATYKEWKEVVREGGVKYKVITRASVKKTNTHLKNLIGLGMFDNRRHMMTKPVVFIANRDKGNERAARRYALQNSVKVIYLEVNEKDIVDELRELLDPTIVYCTDKWDILYPKVERSARVKAPTGYKRVSGLFSLQKALGKVVSVEVKELADDATGYYLPMYRNDVTISGKVYDISVFKRIVGSGVLPNLYIARKVAIKKVEGKMELLTLEKLKELTLESVPKFKAKKLAYATVRAESLNIDSTLESNGIYKAMKSIVPLTYSMGKSNNRNKEMRLGAHVQNINSVGVTFGFKIPEIAKLTYYTLKYALKLREEKADINEGYPLLCIANQNSYKMTEESWEDLRLMLELKLSK